jgi:hypothetical protein
MEGEKYKLTKVHGNGEQKHLSFEIVHSNDGVKSGNDILKEGLHLKR